ncbi:hypothetical protein ElyMa_001235500 [Elysia marginata]|uniref:Uncharacterized protein n=1 Tax=Elysia marginata TaxID=1093978 RepID=A0AAV4IAD9_9GAST|nr:hypothetical protein ElyMa_001235500 [Elysia marginata]
MELSSRIQLLLGKAPRDTKLETWCSQHRQRMLTTSRQLTSPNDGRDIDYNWRLSVPEFYYGYTPKDAPVAKEDFEDRWANNQYVAWKYLGRHMYNLLRPP